MGKRWIQEEVDAIAEVRRRLKDEFAASPQFPEVVGDRRILRYLRAKQNNVDIATSMMKDFFKWRNDNNVDAIRQDIVYGGKNTPFKFPKGKKIIELAPQIVITPYALDKKGQPLSLEMFGFQPKIIFKEVTKDEYLYFLTYCLEYRAIVMEQMSHEIEEKYKSENPNEEDRIDGYGVMLLDFTIRDLKGVGLAHLGSECRNVVGAALTLGLSNYPEYLGKSHMINVPWIFNSMWYFVKGFLDEFTLSKISLCGADYMDIVLQDISYENIPAAIGGGFQLYNEPYTFDVSKEGPLYYEGCEQDAVPYIQQRIVFEKRDEETYCYYYNGVTPPDSPYFVENFSSKTNESESAPPSAKQPQPVAPKKLIENDNTDNSANPSTHSHINTARIADHSADDRDGVLKKSILREGEGVKLTKFQSYKKELFMYLLYCGKEQPIILLTTIFLIIYTVIFHPEVVYSMIPTILICLTFIVLICD